MKRIVSVLLLLQFLFNFSPHTYAEATEARFILPASLKYVEDEAFSKTAVKTVVFPKGLFRIGERSFEDAARLTDVYIPESTKSIGKFAFPQRASLTVHGMKGSYAEKWAEEHQLSFVPENLRDQRAESIRPIKAPESESGWLNRTADPEKDILEYRKSEDGVRSMRPQDRPELNPIDYRFP